MWTWSITGVYVPQDLQPSHGTAETPEEAKAAFKAKYDAWLAWAVELDHDVVWHR